MSHAPAAVSRRAIHRATSDIQRPWPLILSFLAPTLLLYGVFFLYPMSNAVKLSFFKGGSTTEHFEFVGLKNFHALMGDSVFWLALKHNLQLVFAGGAATLVLALSLALCLTKCGTGRSFFRVVYLFPNVMAVVAVAILWSFVFNPSFGILNSLLDLVGLGDFGRAWLNEPGTAMWSVLAIHVWSSVGFYIVLLYAGLLRMPQELLEAAQIDGANWWQEFFHVTLPLLSEIMKIAVIYIIINALNVFGLVFLINEGAPNRYNDVLLTYLYEQAFTYNNYGYACAIGVTMLLLILLFASSVAWLFGRKTTELE